MERLIGGEMTIEFGGTHFSGPYFVLEADWRKRLEALRYGRNKWILIHGSGKQDFVSDPRKINELEELHAHDATIVKGWAEEAKLMASGDTLLEQVLNRSIKYSNGNLEHSFVKEGVRFWPIGHNASHYWAAGVLEGTVYIHCYGEACGGGVEETIRPVETGQNWGYVGHF